MRRRFEVHVRGENAVVALGTIGLVEQRIAERREALTGLIRHLRGRLVAVDDAAIELCEPHRDAGAREHAGAVLYPCPRPVIVVRVEADTVCGLYFWRRAPVRVRHAVVAIGDHGDVRILRGECCHLRRDEVVILTTCEAQAAGVDVQRQLESEVLVERGLRGREHGTHIEVGGRAHAFPVVHGTAGRALSAVDVEPRRDAGVGVVVAGHDDGRLQTLGQVPEARQRHAVQVAQCDGVGEQPLLLIRLRDGDLVEVDPVRLGVAYGIPIEQLIGANRFESPVALRAGPRRVALARVHDRAREVVRERQRAAAIRAHLDGAHRGIRRRSAGVGVQRRHRGGPVERVQVGGAVELHRLRDDAHAGPGRGIHEQVGIAERAGGGREPEQRRQPRIGAKCDERAAGGGPVAEVRGVRGAQCALAKHHHVIGRQDRGCDE